MVALTMMVLGYTIAVVTQIVLKAVIVQLSIVVFMHCIGLVTLI